MRLHFNRTVKRSTGDQNSVKLNNSSTIRANLLKNSEPKQGSTRFLSSILKEHCDRLKLLLKEKQTGNNSNKIIEENVAMTAKMLEQKCLSKKQHSTWVELFL